MEKWPNFFIVGGPQCGTTSLYHYLNQHPKIYMSTRKEPYYYSPTLVPLFIHKDEVTRNEYLKFFEGVKDEVAIGEASVSYLPDPESPKLIHKDVPNARIIIILREPIDRYYSGYAVRMKIGAEHASIMEGIRRDIDQVKKGVFDIHNGLISSLYSEQVKRYFDVFGPNQVKVIIFEEFIQDVRGTVMEILKFLGINEIHDFDEEPRNVHHSVRKNMMTIFQNPVSRKFAHILLPKEPRDKIRKKLIIKKEQKPALPEDCQKILKEFFRNDVLKLQEILGRKLPWNYT